MNKFSIITKSVVVAIGMIGVAYADNNNWTGIYAGFDAGFAFNHLQLKSHQLGFTNPDENCNSHSNYSTFFPGIQFGFMHQLANDLVAGVEANATFNTQQKDNLRCRCPYNAQVSDSFSFKNEAQGSLKARVGHVLDWRNNLLLPYVTAGASFAHVGLSYKNEGGDYYAYDKNQAGGLIGAGIEWAFRKNWSLRAEYSYVDYGNAVNLKIPSVYGLIDPNGQGHANLGVNQIALAINYWI